MLSREYSLQNNNGKWPPSSAYFGEGERRSLIFRILKPNAGITVLVWVSFKRDSVVLEVAVLITNNTRNEYPTIVSRRFEEKTNQIQWQKPSATHVAPWLANSPVMPTDRLRAHKTRAKCRIINNLLTSNVWSLRENLGHLSCCTLTSLSLGQYDKVYIWDFLVKTSPSVNKQLVLMWKSLFVISRQVFKRYTLMMAGF